MLLQKRFLTGMMKTLYGCINGLRTPSNYIDEFRDVILVLLYFSEGDATKTVFFVRNHLVVLLVTLSKLLADKK